MSEQKNVDLTPNLGTSERIVSSFGGAYLLYDALTREKKSISRAIAGGYLLFRGASGHCFIYEAGLGGRRDKGNVHIDTSLTVNKPREEVYNFWRELENLPLFMKHLKSVTELDEKISEWVARIPGDVGTITWKSEITNEVQNEKISWRSLADSTIENEGTVRFIDAGKFGTEINVDISYRAPLGTAGEGVARMLNPAFEEMVKEDIKNLRRYMETGEIPTTEGQPSGGD